MYKRGKRYLDPISFIIIGSVIPIFFNWRIVKSHGSFVLVRLRISELNFFENWMITKYYIFPLVFVFILLQSIHSNFFTHYSFIFCFSWSSSNFQRCTERTYFFISLIFIFYQSYFPIIFDSCFSNLSLGPFLFVYCIFPSHTPLFFISHFAILDLSPFFIFFTLLFKLVAKFNFSRCSVISVILFMLSPWIFSLSTKLTVSIILLVFYSKYAIPFLSFLLYSSNCFFNFFEEFFAFSFPSLSTNSI